MPLKIVLKKKQTPLTKQEFRSKIQQTKAMPLKGKPMVAVGLSSKKKA